MGVLAIQRVDGPSLAMLTHPSNSSSFLGVTRPGPLSCRAGHLAGVFFVTPRRVLVRAATRMRKATGASLGPALGHDSTERRRGGIPNTLTSSGSGLKQSAFASAFSRIKVVWRRFPFFFPHIAARPLRRVPSWGGERSRKTAQNPSVKSRRRLARLAA